MPLTGQLNFVDLGRPNTREHAPGRRETRWLGLNEYLAHLTKCFVLAGQRFGRARLRSTGGAVCIAVLLRFRDRAQHRKPGKRLGCVG